MEKKITINQEQSKKHTANKKATRPRNKKEKKVISILGNAFNTAAVGADHQLVGRLCGEFTLKQELPETGNIANQDLVVIDKLGANRRAWRLLLFFTAAKIMHPADTDLLQGIQITVTETGEMTTAHYLAPLDPAAMFVGITAEVAKVYTAIQGNHPAFTVCHSFLLPG